MCSPRLSVCCCMIVFIIIWFYCCIVVIVVVVVVIYLIGVDCITTNGSGIITSTSQWQWKLCTKINLYLKESKKFLSLNKLIQACFVSRNVSSKVLIGLVSILFQRLNLFTKKTFRLLLFKTISDLTSHATWGRCDYKQLENVMVYLST